MREGGRDTFPSLAVPNDSHWRKHLIISGRSRVLLVVFDKKVVKYGDHEAVHAADVADEAQRAAGHYR